MLGICVGMQVLFERGVERGVDTEGLGEWPGTVTELDAPVLPHMGWNTVETGERTRLFRGIEDERFYFVHSFGAQKWHLDVQPPFPEPTLTWCSYGRSVPRRGRERSTLSHPVPPREIGTGRHPAPRQLDRRPRRGYPLRSCLSRECPAATNMHRGFMTDFASRPELILLPAVDVADGKAVRLTQGEAGTETNYGDPVDAALEWARQGAQWIHLVDLDAAFGRGSNAGILRKVIKHVKGVRVELSGGIRDDATLEAALESGAARINLGTAALENPEWAADVIGRYGEAHRRGSRRARHHACGKRLDARGRRPVDGPRPAGSGGLQPLRRHRCDEGRHAARPEHRVAARADVAHPQADRRVGRRSSLDDIAALRELVPLGVEGAIVGKALYAGAFTLAEALDVAGH